MEPKFKVGDTIFSLGWSFKNNNYMVFSFTVEEVEATYFKDGIIVYYVYYVSDLKSPHKALERFVYGTQEEADFECNRKNSRL